MAARRTPNPIGAAASTPSFFSRRRSGAPRGDRPPDPAARRDGDDTNNVVVVVPFTGRGADLEAPAAAPLLEELLRVLSALDDGRRASFYALRLRTRMAPEVLRPCVRRLAAERLVIVEEHEGGVENRRMLRATPSGSGLLEEYGRKQRETEGDAR